MPEPDQFAVRRIPAAEREGVLPFIEAGLSRIILASGGDPLSGEREGELPCDPVAHGRPKSGKIDERLNQRRSLVGTLFQLLLRCDEQSGELRSRQEGTGAGGATEQGIRVEGEQFAGFGEQFPGIAAVVVEIEFEQPFVGARLLRRARGEDFPPRRQDPEENRRG